MRFAIRDAPADPLAVAIACDGHAQG